MGTKTRTCIRCGYDKYPSHFGAIQNKVCIRCRIDSISKRVASKEVDKLQAIIYEMIMACESKNGRRLRTWVEIGKVKIGPDFHKRRDRIKI